MRWIVFSLLSSLVTTGCGGVLERDARTALADVAPPTVLDATADDDAPSDPATPFDGQLASYVRHAQRHSPTLRAQYAQWQAEVARIDSMRALPEPMLRYTVFLSRVETRVGPQRHRFGVSQAFPWPTVLTAGADAASYAAQSAARRYEAEALLLTERVARVYWELWLVARRERVLGEQEQLLRALSEAARGRLEVGSAGLAHLSQAQLAISRLRDMRAGLARPRAQHQATLRKLLSVSASTAVPIGAQEPPLAALAEPVERLGAALGNHPAIEAILLMASAKRAFAARAEAEGLPRFSLGADWIEVGPASFGNPPDSGKDAVSITVGVTVPIWREVYGAKRDAAQAESRSLLARRHAATDAARAELAETVANIVETLRQARLYQSTLIPQAETTLEATLSEYQVGQTGLASALLAQRDLFELQLAYDRALAGHNQAWARLEAVVGRKVAGTAEGSP